MTTAAEIAFPCEWFALCFNVAAGVVAHPILGDVPTCQPCVDRFDLTLAPFEVDDDGLVVLKDAPHHHH